MGVALCLQYYKVWNIEAPFTMSDSIYGTAFLFPHEVHVTIGTLALVVAFTKTDNRRSAFKQRMWRGLDYLCTHLVENA
jgi:heme/copper-type cytochrome/quinol oxidase subunit 3